VSIEQLLDSPAVCCYSIVHFFLQINVDDNNDELTYKQCGQLSLLPFAVSIVAKRYILQQKCLNKWIGSALLGIRRCSFQHPTPTLSPQTLHPQNFQRCTIGCLSNSWASLSIYHSQPL